MLPSCPAKLSQVLPLQPSHTVAMRSSPPVQPSVQNELLRRLPPDVLQELAVSFERVELKRRQVLYERNIPIRYGYFPESGAAALHLRIPNRGTVDVGFLGHSDFVGLPLILATARAPHRCVVQVPGYALRISAERLRQAQEEFPDLRDILLQYVNARFVETAQTAACNTCHSLQQRLARTLLSARERIGSDDLPFTHQALSRILGVRRAGVTTAMGKMEDAHLIRRGRARIQIVDPNGLEAQSCECFRASWSEFQRLSRRSELPRVAGGAACHPAP